MKKNIMNYPENFINRINESIRLFRNLTPIYGLNKDGTLTLAQIKGLNACLQELTDRQKTVIKLKYVENMTSTDIAKKLNLSISRISQIINNCCRKVRKSRYFLHIVEGYDVKELDFANTRKDKVEIGQDHIKNLNFSSRVYNCFIRHGIFTVHDLVNYYLDNKETRSLWYEGLRNLGVKGADAAEVIILSLPEFKAKNKANFNAKNT